METLKKDAVCHTVRPLYSLEKLIEWKQNKDFCVCHCFKVSLYSLEKLIEWKLDRHVKNNQQQITLYSLEKLIEWKQ